MSWHMGIRHRLLQAAPLRSTIGMLPAAIARRSIAKLSAKTVNEPLATEIFITSEPQPSSKIPFRAISFFLIVVAPFIASTLYFTVFASDQYVAEAKFAVRTLTGEADGENLSGGLLEMKSASQDTYVVTSFIHSPEIIRRIGSRVLLKSIFTDPSVDFASRFPANGTDDAFFEYWKKQVTTYVDGPSGIVTLRVSSFTPSNSLDIANIVLKKSEELINELSERARRDAILGVQNEADRAGKIYVGTLDKLNRFRRESGLLSPETQARETGRLLTGLVAQKLELETRQFVAQRSDAEQSPAYQQLALQRQSIEEQISKLQSELTGTDNESIAALLTEFSKLETERIVSEKLYEAARRTYEQTLAESARKALYLVVFAPAMLPEEPTYPRRLFSPFLTLIAALMVWATMSLAWASVQDHRL